MQKQEIKIELKINDVNVKVGHKFLELICKDIPDTKENKKVFSILALSDNDEVREDVSRNEFLSKDTIDILLKDENNQVVDNLLLNRDINKHITNTQLFEIIKNDKVRLLCTIAERIDQFDSCDKCMIIKKLANHKNSKVRHSLFCYGVSDLLNIKILQKLASDKDYDVAYKARKELKEQRRK